VAKRKTNKALAIRDAIAANPSLKAQEIADLLAKQGIKATAQYVYVVKASGKKKSRKTKRVAKKMARRGGAEGVGTLAAAIEFIKAAGGVAQAQAALAQIEEIRGL
jgi:hypothetical protein